MDEVGALVFEERTGPSGYRQVFLRGEWPDVVLVTPDLLVDPQSLVNNEGGGRYRFIVANGEAVYQLVTEGDQYITLRKHSATKEATDG